MNPPPPNENFVASPLAARFQPDGPPLAILRFFQDSYVFSNKESQKSLPRLAMRVWQRISAAWVVRCCHLRKLS